MLKTVTQIALALVCVALLLSQIGTLHQEQGAQYSHTNEYWAQPPSLDSNQYPPISTRRWSFDFTSIEQVLSSVNSDFAESGNTRSSTHDLLEKLYKQISGSSGALDQSRLFFLVEKSVPGLTGQKLVRLLKRYLPYRAQSKALLDQINLANVEQQTELIERFLKTLEQRQIEYFNADYDPAIFEQDNASIEFLMRSKLLGLRKDLTAEQKGAQLQTLQDRYAEFLRIHSNPIKHPINKHPMDTR